MAEQIVNLTKTFNGTVQKGGLFEIDLFEGGFIPESWDIQVTSGKAELVSQTYPGPAGISKKVFRAVEAGEDGEIEIVALNKQQGYLTGKKQTFTVKLK